MRIKYEELKFEYREELEMHLNLVAHDQKMGIATQRKQLHFLLEAAKDISETYRQHLQRK